MFSACFDSIGTKVNGVPLTTTLSEATKQHADVEELQSMPINTALEEADAIANDLDTFDKEAKKWTEDHDFRKSRCSLLALQARTNKNIKDLQQYLKCCKKLRTKARSSRRALKRKWRGNRDKLTAVFKAAGVTHRVPLLAERPMAMRPIGCVDQALGLCQLGLTAGRCVPAGVPEVVALV